MSLHRDPRSKNWLVAYRLADGRRTLRSTHEADRKRAKIVADAMVRLSEEEARPDTTRAFLQRIVDDAVRRLGLDGSTPSNGQVSPMGDIPNRISIKDWFGKWLGWERSAISDRTYVKYSQVANLFLASVPSNKPLTDISEEDVMKFRDRLVESGLQPASVNQYVQKILKRSFKVAVDHGLL